MKFDRDRAKTPRHMPDLWREAGLAPAEQVHPCRGYAQAMATTDRARDELGRAVARLTRERNKKRPEASLIAAAEHRVKWAEGQLAELTNAFVALVPSEVTCLFCQRHLRLHPLLAARWIIGDSEAPSTPSTPNKASEAPSKASEAPSKASEPSEAPSTPSRAPRRQLSLFDALPAQGKR
jgi:hypothetical protein